MKRTSRSTRRQKHYGRFVFRACAFVLLVVGCLTYTQLLGGGGGGSNGESGSVSVDSLGLRGASSDHQYPSYSPRSLLRLLEVNSTNKTKSNATKPTGMCASSEGGSTYPKPVIDPRVAGQECVVVVVVVAVLVSFSSCLLVAHTFLPRRADGR